MRRIINHIERNVKVGKNSLEEKVLDYWFTLEFLGQDKYPQKELTDALIGVKSLKTKLSKGEKGYKSTFDFFEIRPQDNLYEAMRQEAELCHMKKWGNITIYIGKVKRESCIECIAKKMPFENVKDERPEKSFDEIACASLQLTPEGKYIEHSLSLSTIVWAMKQMRNCTGKISDCLGEPEYVSVIEEMEKKFFSEKNTQKLKASTTTSDEVTEETPEINSKQSMQGIDAGAIQVTVLEEIYKHIEKTYLHETVEQIDGADPYELIIGISFQMFADEDTKNKEDDDNYLGLSHDYFSDDLKMILDKVRGGDRSIPKYLLDYISSTHDAVKNPKRKKRIDLVHPTAEALFEIQMQEILNVKNAPIGKWPSKFMPAFMQQIAINLAIKKGTSELFRENGEIFSVNGPPGTGKTTLLKEIVVSNIIERALLMSKYDDPEDAFVEHSFTHGSKQNGAYSQYTRHWYSLKEDRINDYSVLVTSCNNAAVENISKELPLGRGILKDLKSSDDDSNQVKAALSEVGDLFDFSKSFETESYEKNSVEYPDVYFTYYAQKLLDENDAWGLVAASLGKKKNIRDFYKSVLSPLRWDFYRERDSAKNRLPKYKEAKEKFIAQVELVNEIQKKVVYICNLAIDKSKLKQEVAQSENDYSLYFSISETRKDDIKREDEIVQAKLTEKAEESNRISTEKKMLEEKKAELEYQKQEGEKEVTALRLKAISVLNSIGKRPLLFRKAEYDQKLQYAQKVAADYDKQAEKQVVKNAEISADLQRLVVEWNATTSKLITVTEALSGLRTDIQKLNSESAEIDRTLEYKQQVLEGRKEAFEKTISEYRASLKALNDGKELNKDFVRELLSEDMNISTEAQITNPWFTQRFNREREKLFYYAMKTNKEFILSSKKCRDNFTSLAHYWGLQSGDEKEKILFHKEDREACVGALYQTLFLLVPVISTTFASVGTFLRDVKDSKVIGTMIVDEAGQAQPQMAVGALYRSRKAVIVGDPKQVEPVVTDDLKLLKKVFDDPDLKPYTSSKTISIQSCADEMNVFGTYLDNPEHPDFPDWVGCPLLVHRRCISPMYEISNTISYNGIMKQKTGQPNAELMESFIYEKSQWIQITGKEKGNKNHFVTAQADKVCEMLEMAFEKQEFPSLYIISPFTTVVSEMRFYIRTYRKSHLTSKLAKSQMFDDWLLKNIGTVHTFQGKEANEVIFLLGCDGSKDAEGAIGWVNNNIVNVAATRAKFRLYIIGDATIWSGNDNLRTAKNIMDTFAIKEIHSIITDEEMDDTSRESALNHAIKGLPSVSAFPAEETKGEDGIIEYSVNTDGLMVGLETHSFMKEPFTLEQLIKFGFSSQEEISKLNPKVRKNLELGMRLFYFFQPIYEINKDFDASCCAILFCKAMELQMKGCFKEGIQQALPDYEIKGQGKGRARVKLKDAQPNELTLGTFQYVINKNIPALSRRMKLLKAPIYDEKWWNEFCKKLESCTNKRNECCHDGLFEWKHLSQLLSYMFMESGNSPKIAGLMFESQIGEKLKSALSISGKLQK